MASEPKLIIVTSVRRMRRQELWGDTHFARDLAAAMARRGWRCQVLRHDQLDALPAEGAVVLYLRGLREVPELALPTAAWIISHPAGFTAAERARVGCLFSASPVLAERFDGVFLPQATDPNRFRPGIGGSAPSHEVLFVANSRRQKRRAVDYALRVGLNLSVYGRKWRRVYPSLRVAGRDVPNTELPSYYAGASIVLNDHWPDMAEYGIVSNRIFDALACGAPVLTDAVADLDPELAAHLTVYGNYDEFVEGARVLLALDNASRASRSEQARRLVVEQHSFDARAELIEVGLRSLN